MLDGIESLFDFSEPAVAATWQSIDDRVMGGVSRSLLTPTDRATAEFAGDLSLDRGGGFASIRSVPQRHDLTAYEGVAIHVQGDGRTYKLRLRTDAGFDGVAYQAPFDSPADAWTTIRLPFTHFAPTWRGREVPDAEPLDRSAIQTFGLLVAGRQAGAFRLEIAWIGAYGAP